MVSMVVKEMFLGLNEVSERAIRQYLPLIRNKEIILVFGKKGKTKIKFGRATTVENFLTKWNSEKRPDDFVGILYKD